ncbi:MAG: hypothetical protein M3177_01015 [Pseudomonadota bacterium]|nr:hypothetical protein [Pseudomonadota bacterium]
MAISKPVDGVAAVPEPEAFAEAHRELLSDSSIQFELAFHQPPETPAWLEWLMDLLSGERPALGGMFWILAGAAALVITYFLARWLARSRWWRGKPAEEEDWRPAEAPARALLSEADALAAQGRFDEAAHLLLFRSIDDIEARRPQLVRPALTSRDIAALPAIPDRPRSAFARIASTVERSLFARRPLAEADWRDCRFAYEEFAFAEGWRR